MTRRWLCLLAVVTLCASARDGLADSLLGTRSNPSEVQHRIRVVVDRGHAALLVERVVFNPGNKSDQAFFELDVPEGSVATSLKTLGTYKGQPHWFYGDLKEAEEAAREYHELTGFGGYYPKDPALLSWHTATNLRLQVFPCPPKQNKAVGYTLEMPMGYSNGRYRLVLPSLGLKGTPAMVTVQAAHDGDRLFVNDRPLDPGRILAANAEQVIELEPFRHWGVAGELAVADTGFGRSFVHVRYALAKQLSQIPDGAYVVVALDNSRSMEASRKSAVRMAARTLELFPNAQVQVIDFDRGARPRFSSFVPVGNAVSALRQERVPDAGNGSEVDLALSEAERLLQAIPNAKAKRILLFTDTIAPERITPLGVAASVGKSGAIVHIVQVSGGVPLSFSRDDEHPWVQAARLTGGLVWQQSGIERKRDEPQDATSDVYLPLVRPITLDKAIYSFPANPGEDEELGDLNEGTGLDRQGIYDGNIRWARLSGELWSQPFNLTVHPDTQAGKLWSALIFGTEQLSELTEAEMMVLAKRGGAVSPVTSYLAIEPGVRPSTEGLVDGEGGYGEGIGLGSIGTLGHGAGYGSGGVGFEPLFDPEAFLRERLAPKWAQCKGAAGKAAVILETNYTEIADVAVRVEVENAEQFSCLREAAWSLDLRGYRFKDKHHTWKIQL